MRNRARERKIEAATGALLFAASALTILVTAGIVLSLAFEAARFFARVPVSEFLFGLEWSPQTALRADQVASGGSFGAVPVFVGTLLITAIALSVAVPIGLLAAIFMTQYAEARVRAWLMPALRSCATRASRWVSTSPPRARSRRAS
jgi:phosphate transport system permease protein